MTTEMVKRTRRPSWMTPFGREGWGDVFFDRLWPEWMRNMGEEWTPSVDLSEKEGKYTLKAELPGMTKDDISVTYEDGVVTITGKKESKKEEEGADYYVRESRYGSFSRSFRLPTAIDETKVDAQFKDGVLTVFMTKKEGEKTRKIDIK